MSVRSKERMEEIVPLAPKRPLVGAAVVFVIAWLGFVSRRPDQWFAPQFWAEDGSVFFSDAATVGWSSLLKSYAGYLYVLGRVIANLFKPLPWEYLPWLYVIAACVVSALVATRIACARLPLMERILAALALVAVPHSGEVFLNLTNLQWILDALLVVNLLEAAPQKTGEITRRVLEIVIAGLTGPVAIILAPFAFLWGWRWRKMRGSWALILAWIAVIFIQATILFASKRPMGGSWPQILDSLPWAFLRYPAAFLFGDWLHYTVLLGWIATIGGWLAIVVLFTDRTNRSRSQGLWMLLAAAVLLLAGRIAGPYWPNPSGGGARYVYMPFVLIMWMLGSLAAGTRNRAHAVLAVVLFAMACGASLSTWTARPLPAGNWPQQVREARAGLRTQFEVCPAISFPVPPES